MSEYKQKDQIEISIWSFCLLTNHLW